MHAAYAVVMFAITFLCFYPTHDTGAFPKAVPPGWSIQQVAVAKVFLSSILISYKNEYRSTLDKNRSYIFCPNHFSYLDIPAMGLNKFNSIFVGKSDMEKIPLFGFMYKKLHITVNRDSLKSRIAPS